MKKYIYLLIATLLFASCEDVIKVDLEQKQVKIVVDAFVNNLDVTQSIYVKKTANYFAPIGEQDAVENATIYIIDTSNLKLFNFTHNSKGEYTWTPNRATGDTFKIGTQYVLAIINNKDTFLSASTLNPTAPILDIKIIQEKDQGGRFKDGKYAELIADELDEFGNTYWIKSFQRDTFLSELDELNIAWDEGFSPNDQTNGRNFIFPIRYGAINNFTKPLDSLDKVRIEIHSITNETFAYFQILQIENQNGGLFATPPSAIPSNIIPINTQISMPVTGWFNMAAVSQKEVIVD
ncbi:MAG: DUF4249 family protein [Bacteroidia bacterium]|nr:DUF4249 family protein [Bacteroidia bacterium]